MENDDSTYKLVYYPNPALKEKLTEEVHWVTDEHRAVAQKMLRTMYASKGIGLSAPQVGLKIRLLVFDTGSGPTIMFNPFVTNWLPNKETSHEGCLSFPKLVKLVERKSTILVRYRDENNIVHENQFDGLEARVVQHELDHLNGIVMTDYNHVGKRRKA
jgi:peptide deformylase